MTDSHTSTPPQIEVLLATYNGERFLREQIDSVLAQADVQVTILARDDGSTDSTPGILEEYAVQHPQQFRVLQDNIRTGTARGNFGLLLQATTAPYAAFCDQDDVWLPHKLSDGMACMRGLESIHGTELPLLVYSDLRVVDTRLQTVNESLWQANSLVHATTPALSSLLSENVVTGCTALMNRTLIDCMLTLPSTAQMHDHWAALLAASLGALAALPQATVLYRQHDNNVVGAMEANGSLSAKVAKLLGSEGMEARRKQYAVDRAQAMSLLALHGDAVSEDKHAILDAFIALGTMPRRNRLWAISRYGLWRQNSQRRLAQLIDLLRSA